MIFAVVLVVSMTTAILATVYLTSSIGRDERIYEDQVRMKFAIDGASEQIAQDYASGALTVLPSSRTVNVNGVSGTYTITDNSANIPHTLSISGTVSWHGRSITEAKVVGMRKMPSPFYYALFVNGALTSSAALVTGSAGSNGDVCANGIVSLLGTGSTINGDLESSGAQTIGTTSVTGTQFPGSTAVTFPTVSAATYSAAANQTVSKGSVNGFTFGSTGGNYYLVYCSSASVSISGTMSGYGTIFVNGNVTISGPITYANQTTRVAIIASGTITFTSSGPHSGYFYGGACILPVGGITISKGALVVGSLTTTTAPITITSDPSVWLDSTQGTKHRLPGF